MSWLYSMIRAILQKLDQIQESLNFHHINEELDEIEKTVNQSDMKLDQVIQTQAQQSQVLAELLALLTPPPPVAFLMTFTGGSAEMSKPKSGKLKFNVLDNGHATATLQAVDAAGLAATLPAGTPPPSWSAANSDGSAATAIVLTPAADGMSCDIAPSTPPTLASGIVVTASTTLPDGTAIKGDNSADPINVVSGGPTGFVISVA